MKYTIVTLFRHNKYILHTFKIKVTVQIQNFLTQFSCQNRGNVYCFLKGI